jgi:hypothetical protein
VEASKPEAVLTLNVYSFDGAITNHPFVLFGRILHRSAALHPP